MRNVKTVKNYIYIKSKFLSVFSCGKGGNECEIVCIWEILSLFMHIALRCAQEQRPYLPHMPHLPHIIPTGVIYYNT